MYRLSEPSERAAFDRKVENWGAKCYQATVKLFDPPRVLTEEMLRDYLAIGVAGPGLEPGTP